MNNLKKSYRIALYLFVGLLVFFLFWHLNGRPGFTPEMAMRMLERSYLVEDTELLLCEDGDSTFVNVQYKNIVTMDEEHLYYCEMDNRTSLWWVEIGQWQPNTGLWSHRRSTPISHTLGNCQMLDAEHTSFYFSIPLYILPEDENLTWDHVEAELIYDYRQMEEAEYKIAYVYTGKADRAEAGLTTLVFHEDTGYILGDRPPESLEDAADYLFDDISRGDFYAATTLTITLYDGDTPVHTETHDLAEWR